MVRAAIQVAYAARCRKVVRALASLAMVGWAGMSGIAHAQIVGTANSMVMPAGSTDRYFGLALYSVPKYLGSSERSTEVGLDFQINWSNGVFLSSPTLMGMHLSNEPGVEYGPLLEYQPGRYASDIEKSRGIQDVAATFNIGGFYNYAWNDDWRFTSTLMHATNDPGMYLTMGVQRSLKNLMPSHHDVVLSVGMSAANGYYNRKYFGIPFNYSNYGAAGASSSPGSVNGGTSTAGGAVVPVFSVEPGGGIKDVHGGIRWNWELSPSWLLVSDLSTSYLTRSAGNSPLVEKRNYTTFAAGITYRY